MDFTFSAEQDALRSTARSFLTAEAPSSYVRAMLDDEAGVTDAFWAKTVELGWPGLLIPERSGGAGLGLLDAVVLCEETGALPLPGPWFSSAVAGTAHGPPPRRHASARRRWPTGRGAPPSPSRRAARATRSTTSRARPGVEGDDWLLNGHKPVVLDGHTADVAYVVARDADGLAAFALPAPRGELVPSLDVTRKVARLVLDDRPARRVGPPGDQRALLARVIDDIGIALCAESVGACERALTMATEYAKDRVQFDRPIATFQVIKHKIVDMLHQLELARVATHYAAWASQVDDPQREAAAALAKGFVAEAATMITGENIQVHGGMGFTWDIDCHLLFRRVKANDVLFGRQGYQRQRLADLVLGPA